jgi:hypothetical protein
MQETAQRTLTTREAELAAATQHAVDQATQQATQQAMQRAADAAAEQRAALLAALASGPWQAAGDAGDWFYDPPWTLPPLRRNEAVVAVLRR